MWACNGSVAAHIGEQKLKSLAISAPFSKTPTHGTGRVRWCFAFFIVQLQIELE
jgi:hypothetical protein